MSEATPAVRWAILGTGAIATAFARALPRSPSGVLTAVGSGSVARAQAFAAGIGGGLAGVASGEYADVLAREDVDAVYVGTVHTTHAELAVAALLAGKAVLCEKPAALTTEEAEQILAAASSTGMPFVEAYKYRFGPLAARVRDLLENGEIGRLERVTARMGFAAGDRSGRLFDPALAGGAIFDVGGYPASLAIGLARWAGEERAPGVIAAERVMGSTGVDESASVRLRLGAATAELHTSIVTELSPEARAYGDLGSLELSALWGDRARSGTTVTLHRRGRDAVRLEAAAVDPFAAEADAVAGALHDGRSEVAEMPWAQTRDVATMLAAWRTSLA